jgi:hypothetical protein
MLYGVSDQQRTTCWLLCGFSGQHSTACCMELVAKTVQLAGFCMELVANTVQLAGFCMELVANILLLANCCFMLSFQKLGAGRCCSSWCSGDFQYCIGHHAGKQWRPSAWRCHSACRSSCRWVRKICSVRCGSVRVKPFNPFSSRKEILWQCQPRVGGLSRVCQ